MISLLKRMRAYKRKFVKGDPDSDIITADLSEYCGFLDTTYKGDEKKMLIMEGRRQVFLRIFGHTNLDANDVHHMQRSNHERDS